MSKKAESVQTQKESAAFQFSPNILDHLGISAYNSLKKCLAELVANSYDADASVVSVQIPDTLLPDSIIEIEDDGTGMLPSDIRTKFLVVGRNRRTDGQKSPKGRLLIGSKGIGKLAGFGIASKMVISTWRDGKLSHVTIDKSNLSLDKNLEEQLLEIVVTSTTKKHGTRITLTNIGAELQMPDLGAIRKHLYQSLPRAAGFTIKLNAIECAAQDVPGEKHSFKEDVPAVGTVLGYYVLTSARQTSPGLSVRVRGRIVQEPSLFGLDSRAHGYFTAEKVIGEINADFLDPEDGKTAPNVIKTTRDGLLEDSPRVQALNAWAQAFLRKIISGVEESETTKRTDALLKIPEIKSRLDNMPPHVRAVATKVVRAIVQKLRHAEDEEARQLIEWIVRFYESNVLKELMGAIVAAKLEEVERLAGLIADWGLAQVNGVADLIQSQVRIIERLEELIAQPSAKEMELHKLVEKNLWLVREGLEIWSSDKPLLKVLDGKLDEDYKNKKNLRPDLICRSRDGGSDAIVIEFKKPAETIKSEHVTQAMEYEGIIRKHRPNVRFRIYVVGHKYDPSVLAMKEKLANAEIFFWSYSEILQRARIRFEQILEILGR